MKLGTDFNVSFVTVPINSLVHPICVIPDCGGVRDIHFFKLNVTRANYLGKELSSLPIFSYCTWVRENINIGGHQQYTDANNRGFG